MHCHMEDNIIILNEGTNPHSRCSQCDMLVPMETFVVGHLETEMCRRGADKKRLCLAENFHPVSRKDIVTGLGSGP